MGHGLRYIPLRRVQLYAGGVEWELGFVQVFEPDWIRYVTDGNSIGTRAFRAARRGGCFGDGGGFRGVVDACLCVDVG